MGKSTDFKGILAFVQKFPTERVCVKQFRAWRWENGVYCPHCLHKKVYVYADAKRYKCQACMKQFTDTVGTVLENTKLPIRKWMFAIYIASVSKKGVSSAHLSRSIGVTQKTAWFMLQRIREMLKDKSGEIMDGVIEVDETVVGGKSKNKHSAKRDGMKSKTYVFGMLQRGGRIRTMKVKDRSANTLKPIIYENIESQSIIMSDEWLSYRGLNLVYDHQCIDHSAYQYGNGKTYTNSLEGAWSHFKRSIIGVYHHVSKKHMDMYCSEFDFRYNTRNYSDAERFYLAMGMVEGRLKYKDLIGRSG
ncbi:MAG: IS1595 family transposase [Bacteroidia bacterium]